MGASMLHQLAAAPRRRTSSTHKAYRTRLLHLLEHECGCGAHVVEAHPLLLDMPLYQARNAHVTELRQPSPNLEEGHGPQDGMRQAAALKPLFDLVLGLVVARSPRAVAVGHGTIHHMIHLGLCARICAPMQVTAGTHPDAG